MIFSHSEKPQSHEQGQGWSLAVRQPLCEPLAICTPSEDTISSLWCYLTPLFRTFLTKTHLVRLVGRTWNDVVLIAALWEKKVYKLIRVCAKIENKRGNDQFHAGLVCDSYLGSKWAWTFWTLTSEYGPARPAARPAAPQGSSSAALSAANTNLQDQLHQTILLRVWEREDMGFPLGNHRLDNVRNKACNSLKSFKRHLCNFYIWVFGFRLNFPNTTEVLSESTFFLVLSQFVVY